MGLYKFQNVKQVTPMKPKAPDMELTAVKVNGDLYTKRFYSNNKDLVRQASNFGAGDWVELSFDGKPFYNLLSIEAASPPEETPKGGGKPETMDSKPKQGTSFGNVRRSDGTSRGDDTNRSAAIYLAERVVAMGNTEAQLRKEGEEGVLKKMVDVAEKIFEYIAKGNCPDCSGEGGDPLDPPSIDD